MSKSKNEITVIEEGGLIFKGTSDHVRTGFLTMAKNALFICADNIDSMEQHGYLVNANEIKDATQKLYDALMKEVPYKVKLTGKMGCIDLFDLVPRCRTKADNFKIAGAA